MPPIFVRPGSGSVRARARAAKITSTANAISQALPYIRIKKTKGYKKNFTPTIAIKFQLENRL
jgi:hypothetical protein